VCNDKKSEEAEVKALLEYLYLDVKVRSPDEIKELTNEKLEEERIMLTKKSPDKLISDIRGFIEVLLTIKNNNDPDQTQSKAELDSPSDSSMAFGKGQIGKHSVKSVSLFSNKDRRDYYSNLSERQANNDFAKSKADLKRVVHTEMGASSAKNKENLDKSRDIE